MSNFAAVSDIDRAVCGVGDTRSQAIADARLEESAKSKGIRIRGALRVAELDDEKNKGLGMMKLQETRCCIAQSRLIGVLYFLHDEGKAMEKETVKRLIREISSRVDVAANGQTSTEMWQYAEDNLSAPEGMDYWDWIADAEKAALEAVELL